MHGLVVPVNLTMPAIDLFRIDMGRLPSTQEGLGVLISPPANGAESWSGPYLARNRLPADPWGRAYVYEIDGVSDAYKLICYGSDGKAGGEGKAADMVLVHDADAAPSAAPEAAVGGASTN